MKVESPKIIREATEVMSNEAAIIARPMSDW